MQNHFKDHNILNSKTNIKETILHLRKENEIQKPKGHLKKIETK